MRKNYYMKNLTLKSGYLIPSLGFGTWELIGKSCFDAVLSALKAGYTHIDTAVMYENENYVGNAIVESGIKREKLFITTKIWFSHLHHADVIKYCRRSLEQLKTEYLDLLLMHWPNRSVPLKETFGAFEELVENKQVRSIGVSNFNIHHLEDALKATSLPISVNQIEFHPYLYQKELLDFCRNNGIVITAYSPLARGKILKDETIKQIASKRNTEPSQIVLAWILSKNCAAIPKASSESHIKSNLIASEISLTDNEIREIDQIQIVNRTINPGWAEFNY
jgi:2,5-diketo-D-gluconate reductase B